jgi:hypothetical protein
MQTDDLISRLSANAGVSQGVPVPRLLAAAFALGTGIIIVLMIVTLGLRPDLGAALGGAPFWTKFTYTLVLAIVALRLVERAGRPGTKSATPAMLLSVPVIMLGALAIWQLVQPGADDHLLMMGHTARICSLLIAYLAIPLLAASLWVMRSMAPTRLRLAGAAAGLFSGSVAATVYAFHCPETAAAFVLFWYSGGILLSAAGGALLGPSVLRW